MSNPPDRRLGKRDGLRYAITWLHRRAGQMNDPHARAVLNSAAFDLGNEIREGHMPPIPNMETPQLERGETVDIPLIGNDY